MSRIIFFKCKYPCTASGEITLHDENQTPEDALAGKACEKCGRTDTLHAVPYINPN